MGRLAARCGKTRATGLRGNGRHPEGAETPAFGARRLRSPANGCRRLGRDPTEREGAAQYFGKRRSAFNVCLTCATNLNVVTSDMAERTTRNASVGIRSTRNPICCAIGSGSLMNQRESPRSRCKPSCHETPMPRTIPTTSRPRSRSRRARHGTSVKCWSLWITANLPLASVIARR